MCNDIDVWRLSNAHHRTLTHWHFDPKMWPWSSMHWFSDCGNVWNSLSLSALLSLCWCTERELLPDRARRLMFQVCYSPVSYVLPHFFHPVLLSINCCLSRLTWNLLVCRTLIILLTMQTICLTWVGVASDVVGVAVRQYTSIYFLALTFQGDLLSCCWNLAPRLYSTTTSSNWQSSLKRKWANVDLSTYLACHSWTCRLLARASLSDKIWTGRRMRIATLLSRWWNPVCSWPW